MFDGGCLSSLAHLNSLIAIDCNANPGDSNCINPAGNEAENICIPGAEMLNSTHILQEFFMANKTLFYIGARRAWMRVEPDGDVLPAQGEASKILGNLLKDDWSRIYS